MEKEIKKIKLTLQYDGTDYAGWQIQKDETTIQGVLEKAVRSVTGETLRVTGASRTDAGVHAFEQVATFETASGLGPDIFLKALNPNLPYDIRVTAAEDADHDFHPRYRARNKTYSYLIADRSSYSVFLQRYAWQTHFRLDLRKMKEVAELMIGRQDFSCFRASGCSAKHPVREITDLSITRMKSVSFLSFALPIPVLRISISANAFLRHMVRNMVGTLAEVGRGRITSDQLKDIIESRDRRKAGQTAPACGLFLEKMVY